jgi:hypothetical protein
VRWIEQTIDNTIEGDCFRACLASITGRDDIPNLIAGEDWFSAYERWLEPRGWEIVTQPASHRPAKPAIALVPSPTYPGFNHAVVAVGRQFIWDPSPHRNDPGRELGPVKCYITVKPIDSGPHRV